MLKLWRRAVVPIFWTMTVIIYAVAIMPSPQAPDLGAGDKMNHIIAFLMLTFIGRAAYPFQPAWRLGVGLSLFGALIELTQAIPALQREASIRDWIADSLAIIVALAICRMVERWRRVPNRL